MSPRVSIAEFRAAIHESEGSRPECWVVDSGRDDWQPMIDAVHERGWRTWFGLGGEGEVPEDISRLFIDSPDDLVYRLEVAVGTVEMSLYPALDELVFDFDQTLVLTQRVLDDLCEFVMLCARTSGKTVEIRTEGDHDRTMAPTLVYDPATDTFTLHQPWKPGRPSVGSLPPIAALRQRLRRRSRDRFGKRTGFR